MDESTIEVTEFEEREVSTVTLEGGHGEGVKETDSDVTVVKCDETDGTFVMVKTTEDETVRLRSGLLHTRHVKELVAYYQDTSKPSQRERINYLKMLQYVSLSVCV